MKESREEKNIIESDFNRIAQLDHTKWEHNKHYHNFLNNFIPRNCNKALDIGCGVGEFTRLLAKQSIEVVGVDLSPEMIKKAEQQSKEYNNIEYKNADIMEYNLDKEEYDCIVSIATFHHLPMGEIFKKVKNSLKHEGVFLLLDLYNQKTVGEKLISAVVIPINIFMMLIMTGKVKKSKEEIDAWNEHSKIDKYMTIKEIKEIADTILPGAKIKRHVFWRYSLVWKKDTK